tara:strand:- start:126 stop:1178 length:1053 start_codon:yes stop_codon:yes gene_type:complete
MKILITGNLGYIGTELGKYLKEYITDIELVGVDSGLFIPCITSLHERIGDTYYDKQYYIDIRDLNLDILKNFDVLVNLAAVSNDPIGNDFEKATYSINYQGSLELAKLCIKAGVKKFVFASSCSMYGDAGDKPKIEKDPTKPLTAYAKSKIGVEENLKEICKNNEIDIIFLRFATACGVSDRTRLDLVLNDFVASAVKYKKIKILSNGEPWRPLIDVSEMCKAIIWAITTKFESSLLPLSINIGSNEWNYTVLQLAEKVKDLVPKTSIEINPNSLPDKRSYKVDFSLYKKLGTDFYPNKSIEDTIIELSHHINNIDIQSNHFRDSQFIRLNHIKNLIKQKKLNKSFRWIN